MKKLFILILFSLVVMSSVGSFENVNACDITIELCLDDGGGGATPVTEAILTIYSDGTTNSSASSSGSLIPLFAGTHSFVHFENTGNTLIVLGVYYLYPGDEVTIGIYGNKDEHLGVWYNLEAYLFGEINAYDGAKSISMTIDDSDIDLIDDYIDDNNTWTTSFNCSSFASEIWNLVSDITLNPYNSTLGYDTPKKLANEIDDISGYQTGIQFTVDSTISDYVGYFGYNTNGSGTFVEQLPS